MSDLLAEVDEAMRQERMEKFFKEHGKTVLAFIVLTVVLTGAISFYKHWNKAQQEKGTAALTALLDEASFPENITAETALDMRGGLRGVALLTAGSAYLDQDKAAEALPLYKRAADDKGIPADLRDLATIMMVRLDEGADEDAIARLQPIIKDKNNPWRYQAALEAATLHANALNDYAAALELLNTIQQAQNLPETLTNKARALSQIYALKQNEQDQS